MSAVLPLESHHEGVAEGKAAMEEEAQPPPRADTPEEGGVDKSDSAQQPPHAHPDDSSDKEEDPIWSVGGPPSGPEQPPLYVVIPREAMKSGDSQEAGHGGGSWARGSGGGGSVGRQKSVSGGGEEGEVVTSGVSGMGFGMGDMAAEAEATPAWQGRVGGGDEAKGGWDGQVAARDGRRGWGGALGGAENDSAAVLQGQMAAQEAKRAAEVSARLAEQDGVIADLVTEVAFYKGSTERMTAEKNSWERRIAEQTKRRVALEGEVEGLKDSVFIRSGTEAASEQMGRLMQEREEAVRWGEKVGAENKELKDRVSALEKQVAGEGQRQGGGVGEEEWQQQLAAKERVAERNRELTRALSVREREGKKLEALMGELKRMETRVEEVGVLQDAGADAAEEMTHVTMGEEVAGLWEGMVRVVVRVRERERRRAVEGGSAADRVELHSLLRRQGNSPPVTSAVTPAGRSTSVQSAGEVWRESEGNEEVKAGLSEVWGRGGGEQVSPSRDARGPPGSMGEHEADMQSRHLETLSPSPNLVSVGKVASGGGSLGDGGERMGGEGRGSFSPSHPRASSEEESDRPAGKSVEQLTRGARPRLVERKRQLRGGGDIGSLFPGLVAGQLWMKRPSPQALPDGKEAAGSQSTPVTPSVNAAGLHGSPGTPPVSV